MDELLERLNWAYIAILELAEANEQRILEGRYDPDSIRKTVARLRGKAEGVNLAISYVEEQQRLDRDS